MRQSGMGSTTFVSKPASDEIVVYRPAAMRPDVWEVAEDLRLLGGIGSGSWTTPVPVAGRHH